jgi:hypothetical protein
MLAQADFERALALALDEFAPAWTIVGDCAPVDPFDPIHWDSGSRSFQVTLRHRVTGHLKVLGRRIADEPNVSGHPALALSLIGAYRNGNAEPLRRYLEEIGIVPVASTRAPAAVTAAGRHESPGAPAVATTQGDAADRPRGQASPVGSRGRVLGRLRRELRIWQWRRSAGTADL